jgi:serine phosphatase RsbU (regulator of sigma subunit)
MLYTDGITDARNAGDPLGIERLTEVFSAEGRSDAETIVQAAFDAASDAARGNWPDDAAVMVVKTRVQWGAGEGDD